MLSKTATLRSTSVKKLAQVSISKSRADSHACFIQIYINFTELNEKRANSLTAVTRLQKFLPRLRRSFRL